MSNDAQFPSKLQCLFEPKRYKVLWGGRGAGRSWGVARALLIIGAQRPIRVLCAREFQNSISESCHKVLSDQIPKLKLDHFYDIQKQGIYGANGTSFSFEGIKNNTTRIKSYEGVDYCWVEEAVKVSKTSWDILIPTIRKDGSEIWMTFNPELRTDETYTRFVLNANKTVKDSFVVHMTWRDNPWFPKDLLPEMEKMREEDYDSYLNVWEGECLQTLEGAIYAKELKAAEEEERICEVPWDNDYPVDLWLDLGAGRSDATSIWFGQQVAMQNRILDYYENNLSDTMHYAKVIQRKPYSIGKIWLPWDAESSRIGNPMTIKRQFENHFPNNEVKIVPKLSKAEGINAARLLFPNCYFDAERCADGINALRHYRYEVTNGQFSKEPKHDWASHAADAFRYLALTIRGGNRQARRKTVAERLAEAATSLRKSYLDNGGQPQGWMG